MPGQAEDRPGRNGDKDLNLAHLRGGRLQVAGRRGSSSSLRRPGFWLVGDCRHTSAQQVVQLRSDQLSSGLCFSAAAGFWTT